MADTLNRYAGHLGMYEVVVKAADHDKAITAKDARIAELEELLEHAKEGADIVQSLIDNIETKGNYSAESRVNFLRQAHSCLLPALAGPQQADPAMAKNANVAATPSEDGRDDAPPCAIAYMTADKRMLIFADKADAMEWDDRADLAPLYSLEELNRIVAAKDAEIAELDALRNRLSDLLTQSIIAIRGPEPELTRWGYADLPLRVKAVVEELEARDAEIARLWDDRKKDAALIHELSARPARQVGEDAGRAGREQDEREACALQRHLLEHCRDVRPLHAGLMGWALAALTARQVGGDEREYHCDYAGCSQKAHPGTSLCLEHHTPKARAALAPAAVVMPEPVAWGRWAEGLPAGTRLMRYDGDPHVTDTRNEFHTVPLVLADEVARLNRNAIPVELLERAAYLLELGEMEGPTARELRALLGKDA